MGMYISGQWCLLGDEQFRATMHNGTLYFTVHDDGHELCFSGSGPALERLYNALGAHLQDMQRQAHPETVQCDAVCTQSGKHQQCLLAEGHSGPCDFAIGVDCG